MLKKIIFIGGIKYNFVEKPILKLPPESFIGNHIFNFRCRGLFLKCTQNRSHIFRTIKHVPRSKKYLPVSGKS